MKLKKTIAAFLSLSLMISLAACGSGEKNNSSNSSSPGSANSGITATTPKVVLKLGHDTAETSQFHFGATHFAELVAEKSNGEIEIQIFPNSLLGSATEMIEGLTLNTIDIVCVGSPNLAQYLPEIQALTFPFIYRDKAHAFAVVDGEIGQGMLDNLEQFGIVGLAFWENGYRHLTTAKTPVNSVSDVAGLKIRTQESPVQVAFWRSTGADPTPMAFGEVYTALSQGTVDGQENPISIIYSSHLHEVTPNISLTGHVYDPLAVVMSKNTFDSLSPEHQAIIMEAAKETTAVQRQYCEDSEQELLEAMEAEGAIINYEPDLSGFQELAQSIHQEFGAQIGVLDTIEAIKAVQ